MEDIMKFMVRFVVKFRGRREGTVLLWKEVEKTCGKGKMGAGEGRCGGI